MARAEVIHCHEALTKEIESPAAATAVEVQVHTARKHQHRPDQRLLDCLAAGIHVFEQLLTAQVFTPIVQIQGAVKAGSNPGFHARSHSIDDGRDAMRQVMWAIARLFAPAYQLPMPAGGSC
jgi:hypothetical protein